MSIEALKQIWPEWQVKGRPLGKGSFSVVYKAVRRDHGVESYAAIKVISIPTDPSEVDSLRSEGLDMNAARTYLQQIVTDFVNEIQLMESLKGVQNIVSVEDYKVVEKTGEIGWDIYIRMELLTSFNAYICDKKLTEKEVIKLGCDICTALEICAKRNIIHRDIKPENIFINNFGDFKLGDFGIARKLENMTGGLSQKGTFNYMAPEVAKSSKYDARVDIYSLGIVLYRLLNGNRLPFLDTKKQLLDPNEKKNAVDRRLRGEALPAPCDASPAMANLILRACAYDPNMRFTSATEMKQALMSVVNGTYLDKTWTVRKPPDASNQKFTPTVNTFGSTPKKKSKVPAMIATVLAIVILVGAGIFAVPKLLVGNDSTNSSETSDETISKTTNSSDFDEEQIASIISEADTFAAKEDYKGALAKIQTGLATYPKSEELQRKSEEYTSALNIQVKTDAFTTAEGLAQTGDYLGAFNTVDQAMSTIGEDEELASKAKEYEDTYASNVASQVDTYLADGDFDDADQLVSEALKHFPDNTIIKEQQSHVESSKPQNLLDVCPPYQTDGYDTPSTFKMAGTIYTNGFTLNCHGSALFNLNRQYGKLEFDIGYTDSYDRSDCNINIYLDGQLKKNIVMTCEDLPQHIEISLEGVTQLKIENDNPGNMSLYGFANVTVYKSTSEKSPNEPLKVSDDGQYLLSVCPPYQTDGYDTPSTFKLAGTVYTNGFTLNCHGSALFNLNRQYGKLEFDIGYTDSYDRSDCNINIYLDGQLKKNIVMTCEDLPQHIEISLEGVTQLKIENDNPGNMSLYGFANMIVY